MYPPTHSEMKIMQHKNSVNFNDVTLEHINQIRKQIKHGDTTSMLFLGLCYITGNVVDKKQNMGIKLLKKSYNLGNSTALEKILEIWDDKIIEDDKELFKLTQWLLPKFSDCSDVAIEIESALGILYLEGRGTEKNYSEGHKWLNKAAQKNHPEALYGLGKAYRNGLGVEKCHETAIKKWIDSAMLGGEKSLEHLAAYSVLDQNFENFNGSVNISNELNKKVTDIRNSMLENPYHPIHIILKVIDTFKNNDIDQMLRLLRNFMTSLDSNFFECLDGIYLADEVLAQLVQISIFIKSIILNRTISSHNERLFIHYTRAEIFNILFNENGHINPLRLWDITKCDKNSKGYDPEEGEVIYNEFGIFDRPNEYDFIPLSTCFCSNPNEKSEMWKDYANDFTGVALRFSASEINSEYNKENNQIRILKNDKGEEIIMEPPENSKEGFSGTVRGDGLTGKKIAGMSFADWHSPISEVASIKNWKSSNIKDVTNNIPQEPFLISLSVLNENGEIEEFTIDPKENFIDDRKLTGLPISVIYLDDNWEESHITVFEQIKEIKDIIVSLPKEYRPVAAKLIIDLSHIVKRSKYAHEEEIRLLYFAHSKNIEDGDIEYDANQNKHYLDNPTMKPCEIIVGKKVSKKDFNKIKSIAIACGIKTVRKSIIH